MEGGAPHLERADLIDIEGHGTLCFVEQQSREWRGWLAVAFL